MPGTTGGATSMAIGNQFSYGGSVGRKKYDGAARFEPSTSQTDDAAPERPSARPVQSADGGRAGRRGYQPDLPAGWGGK